jgi:hypothetical protein
VKTSSADENGGNDGHQRKMKKNVAMTSKWAAAASGSGVVKR